MSANKRPRIEGEEIAPVTPGAVLRADASFPAPDVFAKAQPYPHGHVEPLLDATFYEGLRAEVKQMVHARKETDLFKLAQSPDLKNLDINPQIHSRIPHLLRLREVLYSAEFRHKIEDSASLPRGTLNGKTDLASSIYTKVRLRFQLNLTMAAS